MDTLLSNATTTVVDVVTTSIPIPDDILDDVPAHHANPVVAFIIGLGIVTLASIMNAAGLNLTKLDHVSIPSRTEARSHAEPRAIRSERAQYPKQNVGRTGCARYGY